MEEDQQILAVKDEDINIYTISPDIQAFPGVEELIDYAIDNYKDFDSFDIYANGRYMDQLIQSVILSFVQVKRVTFYFDSMDDLQQAQQNFSENSSKFKFCLKTEVENRIKNVVFCNQLKSGSGLNTKAVKLNAKERRCRIRRKQGSHAANLLYVVAKHNIGFDVRNMDIIHGIYLCELCGYIFRDPVQLDCGHRVCKSCAGNWEGDTLICPECDEKTQRKDILMDRGFKRDMHMLEIGCSLCNWDGLLKDYEYHLHLYHSNLSCEYCGSIFISTEHLSEHQRINCSMIIVPCPLKDYGCSDTINRLEMTNHYLTEEHQRALIKVISNLLNQSQNVQNQNVFATSVFPSQEMNEIIDIFADGIRTLTDDVQACSNENHRIQNVLDTLTLDNASMNFSINQHNVQLDGLERQQQILRQHIASLQKETDNTADDGIFVWRITNVCEKMKNAQSGNQTAIYSPPFYSSPTGYKMCVRLHLHDDGNDRAKHVSFFLVLMRGKHDALLPWPFKFRIIFCLWDQTSQQSHIIDFFRPDIKLNSFQRPRSDMNIASGIPKFCALEVIEQENNSYVRNDTMFIKTMVDFGQIPDNMVPYALSLNPGLPTHRQHQMIQTEIEKAQQHQSTTDS